MSSWASSVSLFVGTSFLVAVLLKKRRTERQEACRADISKAEVFKIRRQHFSSSNSVSYANTGPLMILKGRGCQLIDESGVSFLDTRNNVAHVGHCHPRVVKAIQNQVAQLNTNTRYLHPVTCTLAKRLVDTLPDPLDTVFFCNSGSEANDLALRLARAWADGSNNTIVVEGAYHGHTLATLEVSPYKYENSGEYAKSGNAPGQHVWKVPCPDVWRGRHRDKAKAGVQYAAYVQEACRFYQRTSGKVRAFIIEGGMSVAGVILPPAGYLRTCVEAVHKAGGLYIADEVQTGFGRLGLCFWAFQYQESDVDEETVVPDIVTMGKPFGNGMPLAAVVTSRKVAKVFENCECELFNTFGGNPVSASAGLAVLDVIEEEKLQQNALNVGTYLKAKLQDLQKTIDLVGDVRGSGLFLGVELVRDKNTLEPATAETSWLCSLLKTKYRILTSIDGPHNNVLVIKPPMVFKSSDADHLVGCLKRAFTADLIQTDKLAHLSATPT